MARGQQSKLENNVTMRPTKSLYAGCGTMFRGTEKAIKMRQRHHQKHCSICANANQVDVCGVVYRNMSKGDSNNHRLRNLQ